jgi:hypothetical protein
MSGIEDIPLIGGIAETAIHGAEAVGDAVTGDWDGAAHEAYGMAGSALHTVADDLTGGVFGVAEGVYDSAAGGLGLPTSDDISSGIEGGLHDLGNALGDGVYDLVNGSGDVAGAAQYDQGGQGGQDGGDLGDPYGAGDGGMGDMSAMGDMSGAGADF